MVLKGVLIGCFNQIFRNHASQFPANAAPEAALAIRSITISAKYVHTSENRLKEAVAALEAAASTSQPLQMAAGASE